MVSEVCTEVQMTASTKQHASEDRCTSAESSKSHANSAAKDVECIDIADEEDDEIMDVTPSNLPAKESQNLPPASSQQNGKVPGNVPKTPVQDPTSKQTPSEKSSVAKPISCYNDLLDKVNDHVQKQLDTNKDLGRRIMDVMLAAINHEVVNDPHSVRKLIIDKQLVLPNVISHPPSQCVQLLIEHEPENTLSKVIERLYGADKPKESDQEKLEKVRYRKEFAAPAFSRTLAQIGQELVQEFTYGDIVHARNLPDMPKDIEGYKKVAEQLKPVWQNLKAKNAAYKCKQRVCRVCHFKTDSLVTFSKHQATLHYDGKRYSCTKCSEFNNNVARMKRHYMDKHGIVPFPPEESSNRLDCPICEEDFRFKGELNSHLKDCKKQNAFHKRIMQPTDDDKLAINSWYWDKPTPEPSVVKAQPKPAPPPVAPKMVRAPAALPPTRPPAPAIANNATAAAARTNVPGIMAVLATLSSNPQALEKIKNDNPALYRQLHAQFTNIRNNPMAMNQLGGMLQRPQVQAARSNVRMPQRTPPVHNVQRAQPAPKPARPVIPAVKMNCEICDNSMENIVDYLKHLQTVHKRCENKTIGDMQQGAPLACSRCQERFWCYEGLERHLVMEHGLVTQEFLRKAQAKQDGGRCQICKRQYAFNMLQHLVQEHNKSLCSAEIRYSCDVCQFSCTNYQDLEKHLSTSHPKKNAN